MTHLFTHLTLLKAGKSDIDWCICPLECATKLLDQNSLCGQDLNICSPHKLDLLILFTGSQKLSFLCTVLTSVPCTNRCVSRHDPVTVLSSWPSTYRPVEMWWHTRRHQISSFGWNGRVYLNRQGCQFCRLLAAEVCASAVVMLDTPCSEVVWRVLATHSIRQFPLHLLSRTSPCAITFQLESTRSSGELFKVSGAKCPSSFFFKRDLLHRQYIQGVITIIINIKDWTLWSVPSPELQLLAPTLLRSSNCSPSLWSVVIWFQRDSVLWHSLLV